MFCRRQLVEDVVYAGKRIAILDSKAVQSAIVYTQSPCTILFADKKYGGSSRTCARSYETLIDEISKLGFSSESSAGDIL